jgi:hypothetical protein
MSRDGRFPAHRLMRQVTHARRHQSPATVVIFAILALLAFALCSCADSYDVLGLHLKPAANGDYDNAGHVPGSGDPE